MTPQLEAMLGLLRDDAGDVRVLISEQLPRLSEADLRHMWQRVADEPGPPRDILTGALERAVWQRLSQRLRATELSPAHLQELLTLIAEAGRPTAFTDDIDLQLNELAEACRSVVDPTADLLRQAGQLAVYLGQTRGFRGNRRDYYAAENSFLDVVLQRRLGIPISLSALYILVGERLQLPIYGVGLPSHFIVGIADDAGTRRYFDPFRQGRPITVTECARLVEQAGFVFHPDHLHPVTTAYIVVRTLRNLLLVYQRRGEARHHAVFSALALALDETVGHN